MLTKGTICVRTKAGLYPDRNFQQKEGFLFAAHKDSGDYEACYSSSQSIQHGNFRPATEAEINLYKKGHSNIFEKNIILPKWFNNFLLKTRTGYRSKDFIEFKKLCEEIINIEVNRLWSGGAATYGRIDDVWVCNKDSKSGTKIFEDIEEFKNELLTIKINKNEKSTKITTEPGRKIIRNAITSSSTRQIATASRLIGNKTSAKHLKTRIGESKISFSVVSY